MEQMCSDQPVIKDVTPQLLDQYMYSLLALGLAPRTRRHSVYVLKSFLKYCAKMGIIDRDPSLDLVPVSVPKLLPSYLEADQVQRFLDHCEDPLVHTVVSVLYFTGLRIGELCTLGLTDVDAGWSKLRVYGKGAKERIVPLNLTASEVLRHYVTEIRPECDSSELFITKRGRPLDQNWAGILIRREAKRQGWREKITPHVFRHSHATALYHQGVGLPTIAAILGHASLTTTEIYTHLSSRDLRDAVDRLL